MPKPVATNVSDASSDRWDPTDSIMAVVNEPTPDDAPAAAPAQAQAQAPAREPVQQAAPTNEPEDFEIPASAIPANIIPGVTPQTPAQPAQPAESSEPEEPSDVKSGDPKARHAWSKTKAQLKEQEKAIKEYEQKVKDLEGRLANVDQNKPPEMQKLLELEQKNKEYEERIGQLDITQTREFKTRFDLPIERTLKKGEATLIRAGVPQAEAATLMRKLVAANAEQTGELIADLPNVVQGALYNITTDFSQMVSEREDAIKNWRETRPALQEQSARNQEITLAEDIEKDTSEAVQQALKEGNWMFAQNDQPAWNADVANRVNMVKGILRTAKSAELVKWVAEGVTAKATRDLLIKEHERANKLAAELAARTNARPRLGGGNSEPAPRSAPVRSAQSPESVVDALFAR